MYTYFDVTGKKFRMPTVTQNGIYGFFHGYSYLSNFHECQVKVDGWTYNFSEAAYMAQKCTDPTVRAKLASMTSPSTAKKYGQTVPLREDWETFKVLAMMKVLLAKFNQNPELKRLLLDTGDLYLEETNDWDDKFWGVCENEGHNMLGQCLMVVRDNLK